MVVSRNAIFDKTKTVIKEASDSLDFSDGSGSVTAASEASDNSAQEDHETEEEKSSQQKAALEEASSQEASSGEASTDTFPQSSAQQAGSCYPTRQRDKPKERFDVQLTEQKPQSMKRYNRTRRR